MINTLYSFQKAKLLDNISPIIRLENLEKHLGLVEKNIKLFMKHEATSYLGLGGNKIRKLEYLLGDAQKNNATAIITMGGIQSNHARLTAAACAKLGLRCELVLAPVVDINHFDYYNNGNLILNDLLNANVHMSHPTYAPSDIIKNLTKRLEAEGHTPYVIPTGGSTPIGCLGYVEAAHEITQQESQMNMHFDSIHLANGSSGTYAGLFAGFTLMHDQRDIHSYSVLHTKKETEQSSINLINNTLELFDEPHLATPELNIDDRFIGTGYGQLTHEVKDALRLMAQHEGIFLDPVYSGKAFTGLLHQLMHGEIKPNHNILYIMTGGTPALHAYSSLL